MLKYEVSPGSNISDTSEVVAQLASKNNVPVEFEFNGVHITVNPGDAPDDGEIAYYKAMNVERPKRNSLTKDGLYPETAEDGLKRWDAGQQVFTIEMGGLGPGYEQCIHICCMEIIRDYVGKPLPDPESPKIDEWWRTFGAEAAKRTDASVGGYSGAQVGAAKSLAYRYLRDGWAATLSKPWAKDRHIQVSRSFPQAPVIEEHA